jgi:hypothetical protein
MKQYINSGCDEPDENLAFIVKSSAPYYEAVRGFLASFLNAFPPSMTQLKVSIIASPEEESWMSFRWNSSDPSAQLPNFTIHDSFSISESLKVLANTTNG